MKKIIKPIIIIILILIGVILIDTIQARIFKNSPIISWKESLSDNDSYVYRGILIDTYYCTKEKDIVTVSYHFKTSKFNCPIDNEVKTKNDDSQDNKNLPNEEEIRYVIMNDENGNEYKIYYYGIYSAIITVGENNYDFEQAILTKTLTLDEILNDLNIYAELNDGGTKIYKDSGSRKYFNNSYTIIKCNTVDGNRDIYIGNNEMEYKEEFCKFKTTIAEIKLKEEINKMKNTKKIIVKNIYTYDFINTITDKNKIKNIIDMLSRSTESTLPVTSEGTNLIIQMYDNDNKLLNEIHVWKSGYFGFDGSKGYFISNEDIDIFKDTINK